MRWFRRKKRPSEPQQQPPWSVTACGRLLALHGLGFAALAWLEAPPSIRVPFADLWLPGLFALLALATLLDSISFLRLRPGAWSFATFLQGLALGLALWLYFNDHPAYVYALMVYGIFMVAYLNHPEVRAALPQEPLAIEENPAEDLP